MGQGSGQDAQTMEYLNANIPGKGKSVAKEDKNIRHVTPIGPRRDALSSLVDQKEDSKK